MIYEMRHTKPQISFGLGIKDLVVSAGSQAFVWISSIHGATNVPTIIVPKGLRWTKESNQKFRIECDDVGVYEIKIIYEKANLKSNTLTLTVV